MFKLKNIYIGNNIAEITFLPNALQEHVQYLKKCVQFILKIDKSF